jgi:general secretion pathway protein K
MLLLGGLDWARAMLRSDERSSLITHREQAWATPITNQRVSKEGDARQAWLSGRIEDEQGKFNLTNLAIGGVLEPEQVQRLARLLTSLNIAAQTAPAIAARIARGQARRAGRNNTAPSATASDEVLSYEPPDPVQTKGPALALGWQSLEDLRAIEGIDAQVIDMLRPYLTILPQRTALNVNTTTPEVLAALSLKLDRNAAAMLMDRRDRGTYFNDVGDFNNQLSSVVSDLTLTEHQITTTSNWFSAVGTVRIDPTVVDMRALIERGAQTAPRIVWIQEIH